MQRYKTGECPRQSTEYVCHRRSSDVRSILYLYSGNTHYTHGKDKVRRSETNDDSSDVASVKLHWLWCRETASATGR